MRNSAYPDPPIPGWKLATVLGYLTFAGGGLWALVLPPISYDVDAWVRIAWGTATFAGGLATSLGVITGRYRWEWFGSWAVAFGFVTYAVMSWNSVITESTGHGPRAMFITGFALITYARALFLRRVDQQAQNQRRREVADG